MNTVVGLILFAAIVLAAFFVIRKFVKIQFPNLGRIVSALLLVGGTLLDQLNALPWGQVLSETQAKLVGFALVLGMAILHVADMVKAQINPPPPSA